MTGRTNFCFLFLSWAKRNDKEAKDPGDWVAEIEEEKHVERKVKGWKCFYSVQVVLQTLCEGLDMLVISSLEELQ